MSIIYKEQDRLFTLHTKHTTYQMQVDDLGFLHHLYYGRSVNGMNMNYLNVHYDRGFSGNPYEMSEDRTYSTDTFFQEYSGFGVGDYRIHGVEVVNGDGSCGADFRYVSHRIRDGKYEIPGLPCSYDNGGEAQTLVITLQDMVTKLELHLYYGVFEKTDMITRAAKFVNGSLDRIKLHKAASVCLDVAPGNWDLIHMAGRYNMERQAERTPLMHCVQSIESKRGQSSHHHNPFVILCDHHATEDAGDCCGMMLVYSGSHKTEIELDQLDQVRIVSGIHDASFVWNLEAGESFYTPEVLLSFTHKGLAALSHNYHNMIRHNICRGPHKLARRPVLINNWEATYFDFTSEKLLGIARQAADLGVELFVLDDGWFGQRNSDREGLGDWFVNETKLNGSLEELIGKIKTLGLKFGIWIEPEMISENSQLYREHPDWALTMPGRKPNVSRSQLVLDMSRQDVRDYLYGQFSELLAVNSIDYVKWDMNRSLADVYSWNVEKERQGEIYHRFMLGSYELMERLTKAFPNVLIEGCCGGGGRFDAGILCYSPQIWCSDDTDPVERLKIQYGTSFGYPVSAVGSHVSAAPNHQTGRITSLHTRGVVAMSGTFGYEMNPEILSEEDKEEIRQQIETFKKYYWLIQDGDYYRLTDAMSDDYFTAWQFAAKDKSEALVNMVVVHTQANPKPARVCLKGLDPDAWYQVEGEETCYQGAALMYGGYVFPKPAGDYLAVQVHLVRV